MPTKKISWPDLKKSQQKRFENKIANGCGPAWSPWLKRFLYKYFFAHLFHAFCIQHDFNFVRGGNLYNYFKANWDMTRFVFVDFWNALRTMRRFKDVTRTFIFMLVGVVWLTGITLGGWISFKFGRYRTLEEIFNKV